MHFEYNRPLSVFNYAIKHVEVSHWGNLAVKEQYQIINNGAEIEGEFGRVDYDDVGIHGGKNAINSMRGSLPMKAWNVWYGDEIGNVSTSHSLREWDDVRLDLEPRFPILGGWKSNFDIGYSLPSKFNIWKEADGLFRLNITFGTSFSDILAKDFTMLIALPNGATDIKVNLPLESSEYSITEQKYYSYLDFTGRPQIVINMKNCYDIHKTDFVVIV